MELSTEQIIIIGLVTSVVVQALKLILAKFGNVKLSTTAVQWVAVGVSTILALGFLIPVSDLNYTEPIKLVTDVVALIGSVFGLATVIYVLVLKRLVDGLGLTEERVMEKPKEPVI